jgi:hypothetical protein
MPTGPICRIHFRVLVGQGFRPAAGLLAGVFRFAKYADFARFAQLFASVDAEQKLGGRAEALPHKARINPLSEYPDEKQVSNLPHYFLAEYWAA